MGSQMILWYCCCCAYSVLSDTPVRVSCIPINRKIHDIHNFRMMFGNRPQGIFPQNVWPPLNFCVGNTYVPPHKENR